VVMWWWIGVLLLWWLLILRDKLICVVALLGEHLDVFFEDDEMTKSQEMKEHEE
jgi:hypothetical protein